MSARETDRRLSRLLAQVDPAASEAGLATEDARWMKAAMLAELSRAPRRRAGLSPLWVAISAAVVISGLGLAWWFFREPEAASTPAIVATAAPDTAVVAPPRLEATSPTEPRPRPTQERPRARAPKAAPVVAARTARHLEFQTPGGTRVVWVLDPNFNLENTEATSR